MSESVFSMSAALTAALRTLDAEPYDPGDGVERDGAYLYARGLRHELLANCAGIPEIFAPYLVAGVTLAGLESRSVAYHPQELLAAIEFVCLETSSSWQPRPLYAAMIRGMGEDDLTRNLVLISAGLLSGVSDAIGADPADRARAHRTAFSEDMVASIDWDALLGRGGS